MTPLEQRIAGLAAKLEIPRHYTDGVDLLADEYGWDKVEHYRQRRAFEADYRADPKLATRAMDCLTLPIMRRRAVIPTFELAPKGKR